jgi:hypothetical protein
MRAGIVIDQGGGLAGDQVEVHRDELGLPLLHEAAHPLDDFTGPLRLGIDRLEPGLHLVAVALAGHGAQACRAVQGNGGQRLVDLVGDLGRHFAQAGETRDVRQFEHVLPLAALRRLDRTDIVDHDVKAAHASLGRGIRQVGNGHVTRARVGEGHLAFKTHRFPGERLFDVGARRPIGVFAQQLPHGTCRRSAWA